MVSEKGLEPIQISPHEPESCASTNSATQTYHYSTTKCFKIKYQIPLLNGC